MRTAAALLALSAAAGAQSSLWTFHPEVVVRGLAVDATGAVVVAGRDRAQPFLARLGPDGSVLSATAVDTFGAGFGFDLGPPLPLPDGTVVAPYGVGPWLVRLGADGTLLWTIDTGARSLGRPALASDGTLLVPSERTIGAPPPRGFPPAVGAWQRVSLDGALLDSGLAKHDACCGPASTSIHRARVAAHPRGGFAHGVYALELPGEHLTSVLRHDGAGEVLWSFANDPQVVPSILTELVWLDEDRLALVARSAAKPHDAQILAFDDTVPGPSNDPAWAVRVRGLRPHAAIADGNGAVVIAGSVGDPFAPRGALAAIDRDGALLWARELPAARSLRGLARAANGDLVALSNDHGPGFQSAIYRLAPDGAAIDGCPGVGPDPAVALVPLTTAAAVVRAGRSAPFGIESQTLTFPHTLTVDVVCP